MNHVTLMATLCIANHVNGNFFDNQLASIPNISSPNKAESVTESSNTSAHIQIAAEESTKPNVATTKESEATDTSDVPTENPTEIENVPVIAEQKVDDGVRASDDTRYRKFFKMLQFGVPAPAVKLKMQTEGFDPSILE